MNKKSKPLLPGIVERIIKAPVNMRKSAFMGSPHANTQRHVAGLRKNFSKKAMEKQATYLLSINYLQMKSPVKNSATKGIEGFRASTPQ